MILDLIASNNILSVPVPEVGESWGDFVHVTLNFVWRSNNKTIVFILKLKHGSIMREK